MIPDSREDGVKARRQSRESVVHSQQGRESPYPHGSFTADSLLRPMVDGMQTIDATSLPPIVASTFAMSSGRLGATAAALLGLVGTVIGGLALARSNRRTRATTDGGAPDVRGRATMALVLGVLSTILGVVYVATADGGLGTGNGLGGAIVAVALGLIAIALGGLARTRRRQVA